MVRCAGLLPAWLAAGNTGVSPLRFASVEMTGMGGAPGGQQIPFGDDRKKGKGKGGRALLDTHLSRDEAAAKMGHPALAAGRNTGVSPLRFASVEMTGMVALRADSRSPSGMTERKASASAKASANADSLRE